MIVHRKHPAPAPRSRRTRGLVLALPAVALVAACEPESGRIERFDAASDAPRDSANVYAERVLTSLGGSDAWDRTRYLSFRWLVEREGRVVAEREHAWDRYDGRYRLAFRQRDTAHVMLFDVSEVREDPLLGSVPAGRAWKGATELTGAAADSALRRAYGIFINDTYWALMPFKWMDPGVHLTYEGMRTLSDGADYATIHLTFDPGLGITEDEYWGFVDPATGRMAAWQYHLGRSEERGGVMWWRDWERVGEIRFAMSRVDDEGTRFIYFEDVTASATVPKGRFDPPQP